MRARAWPLILVLAVAPSLAHAGKIRDANDSARGSSSGDPRANPPSGARAQPITPQRSPARSSDDSGVPPDSDASLGDFYGYLFWQMLQFPIAIHQLILESNGPRAFVYESRPYAHGGKGIVRHRPWAPILPQVEPRVYLEGATPDGERDWMPGERVEETPTEDSVAWQPSDASAIEDMGDNPPEPYAPEITELPTQLAPEPEEDETWKEGGQDWALQVSADAASIDSDTWRIRPRLRLLTPSRIELDAESAYYHERLSGADVRELGRDVDWMSMSTVHIAWRFAQSQAVQFRLGVGARLMATHDAAFLGWDANYGFDAFIHKPLILSASVGVGSAGEAIVTEVRGSLGVVVGAVELMLGGERVAVGDTVFAGPTVGVRIWF